MSLARGIRLIPRVLWDRWVLRGVTFTKLEGGVGLGGACVPGVEAMTTARRLNPSQRGAIIAAWERKRSRERGEL